MMPTPPIKPASLESFAPKGRLCGFIVPGRSEVEMSRSWALIDHGNADAGAFVLVGLFLGAAAGGAVHLAFDARASADRMTAALWAVGLGVVSCGCLAFARLLTRRFKRFEFDPAKKLVRYQVRGLRGPVRAGAAPLDSCAITINDIRIPGGKVPDWHGKAAILHCGGEWMCLAAAADEDRLASLLQELPETVYKLPIQPGASGTVNCPQRVLAIFGRRRP